MGSSGRTIVVVVAALLVGAAWAPAAGAQVPQYPNLIPDPPGPRPPEVYSDGAGTRLLVRFSGYVHNVGPGAVELRGSSPFGPIGGDRLMGSVVQRIYDDAGGHEDLPTGTAVLRYETNDGHRHWHLLEATRYSLWDYDREQEVGPASKIGFCLADIQAVDPWATEQRYRYNSDEIDACSQEHTGQPDTTGPNADSVLMGISPGWRDEYAWTLALQWVDISDLEPGHYWLRSDMNPAGVVIEDPEAPIDVPAWAPQATTLPGYIASPVAVGHVPANKPSEVALASTSVGKNGSDADRWLKVVEQPEHGTLRNGADPVGGAWFWSGSLTYVPDRNYFGPDSFRFVAGDRTRLEFPRNPAAAAVVMEVGTGAPTALAISGAPASIRAGTSVQLDAVVTAGDSPDVAWKVDGVEGGGPVQGTITSAGLYTAPPIPPVTREVRISATAPDGTADAVTIAIERIPDPVPAPAIDAPPTVQQQPPAAAPPGPTPAPQRRAAATRPKAQRRGRQLLVRIVPPRPGRLRIRVLDGRTRVAQRRIRVAGGVATTSRLRLPARYRKRPRARLRVQADLRAGGRVVRRWAIRVRRG